jgi:hypothetical protein
VLDIARLEQQGGPEGAAIAVINDGTAAKKAWLSH